MDEKTREILQTPFPEKDIKQRRGSFGVVRYVDGAKIIQRLNDAFEADWSFQVVEYKFLENEVLVLGKLTAGGITKMAFGGSSITRSRETGEPVSMVDDAKSATMDAAKKAASWLGLGLSQLYCDSRLSEPARNNGAKRQSKPGRNGDVTAKGNGRNGPGSTNGTNGNRLTQKQLSAVWALARKAGYSSDEIRKRCIECCGVQIEHLSRADASAIIGDLSNELGDSAFNGSKS